MTTAVEPNDLNYAFDPYGNTVANRITNEYHIITADNSRKYNVLVPLKAPFFTNGFKLSSSINGGAYVELKHGVHYTFGYEHMSASRKCGKPLAGCVVFTDERYSGNIRVDRYQTLGGYWVNDAATLAELVATTLYNPRVTTWEKVLGLPYEFPTIDHEHNVEDLGMSSVVAEINRIGDLIEATGGGGGGGGLPSLEALGLDQVPNFPPASDPVASAAASRNHLMTPYGTRLAIEALVLQDFLAFVARRDNPNKVTAAQVNAYTKSQVDQILTSYLGINATAANSTLFDGYTVPNLIANILQRTIANSDKLEGMTALQLQQAILQGTAANSLRFAGKTYAELLNSIQADSSAGDMFGRQQRIEASVNLPNQNEYIFLTRGRSIADSGFQDGYILITGGNTARSGQCPIWLLRAFNTRGEANGHYGLEVIELTNTGIAIDFGMRIIPDPTDPVDVDFEIWLKGRAPIDEINLNFLTKGVFWDIGAPAFTLDAPINVTWIAKQSGIWNSQRLGGNLPSYFANVNDVIDAINFAKNALKQ